MVTSLQITRSARLILAHRMHTDSHGSVGSGFEAANVLGSGFLEKIYERALIRELALSAKAQCIKHLKASAVRMAVLINFQKPKLEWKRILLDC